MWLFSLRLRASLDKLRELNPYVNVEQLDHDLSKLSESELIELVKKFNCVIVTELADQTILTRLNTVCRESHVHFVLSDVFGLFGYSFTDLGDSFETLDPDGEEYREMFVAKISSEPNACVEVLDQHAHNLEANDLVRLTQVEGPNELNDQIYQVTNVVNSYRFRINADTSQSQPYARGGIFKKIKKKLTMRFESLREQLNKPEVVLAELSPVKFGNPYLVHIVLRAHLARTQDYSSMDLFLTAVHEVCEQFKRDNSNIPVDLASSESQKELTRLARVFFLTRRSRLPPLSAIYGGICAQEALKAITSKFVPIKQWLYLEFCELFEIKDLENLDVQSK